MPPKIQAQTTQDPSNDPEAIQELDADISGRLERVHGPIVNSQSTPSKKQRYTIASDVAQQATARIGYPLPAPLSPALIRNALRKHLACKLGWSGKTADFCLAPLSNDDIARCLTVSAGEVREALYSRACGALANAGQEMSPPFHGGAPKPIAR